MSSPTFTGDGPPNFPSYDFAGFPSTIEQVDSEKDPPADTSDAPSLLEVHLHNKYPHFFPYGDPDPTATAAYDLLGDFLANDPSQVPAEAPTAGIHIDDTGEILVLKNYNHVAYNEFVSPYHFLGWISVSDIFYPFFTSNGDILPNAFTSVVRFGYARLPDTFGSKMIPLFCMTGMQERIKGILREVTHHIGSVNNHHGAAIYEIPSNYRRVFFWYHDDVLNPIDPTTGLEVGASQRGKKRERSGSATLNQVSEASSSKKVATGKPTPNSDPNCYSFKAFLNWRLHNVSKLSKWAKYHFRFILITEPPAYLTPEAKIILATTSYEDAKTALPNFRPEINYIDSNGTTVAVEEPKIIALVSEEQSTFLTTCAGNARSLLTDEFLSGFASYISTSSTATAVTNQEIATYLLEKAGSCEASDFLALKGQTGVVTCPFGSAILGQMIHTMCFKRLLHEKVTLAQKFGGALSPGKPIPEATMALASSILCDALVKLARQHIYPGSKYPYFQSRIKEQGESQEWGPTMLTRREALGVAV